MKIFAGKINAQYVDSQVNCKYNAYLFSYHYFLSAASIRRKL